MEVGVEGGGGGGGWVVSLEKIDVCWLGWLCVYL